METPTLTQTSAGAPSSGMERLFEKVLKVNENSPDQGLRLKDEKYASQLEKLCNLIEGRIPDWADGVVIASCPPILLPGVYPIRKSKFNNNYYFKRYWRSLVGTDIALELERGERGKAVALGNLVLFKDGRLAYPKRIVGNWQSDYVVVEVE